MSLNPSSLQSALESLFANPPGTRAQCADAWADAIDGYATAIVPAVAPPAFAGGIAALSTALASAFAAPSAAAQFDAAFSTFAATIATGMAPAFTALPPAAPLNIAAQLAGTQPTHAAAAAAFAALIDAWFRTGTATLTAPPNTPVTWS